MDEFVRVVNSTFEEINDADGFFGETIALTNGVWKMIMATPIPMYIRVMLLIAFTIAMLALFIPIRAVMELVEGIIKPAFKKARELVFNR